MTRWLDDLLPDWDLGGDDGPSEAERAYLFNDVGLLRYVHEFGDDVEALEGISPDA